jgi:hypothetical protein
MKIILDYLLKRYYDIAKFREVLMENAIARNTTELEQLEGVIQKNIGAFYEVGRALMEIRDKGLYRDVLGYDTFEAYCKHRWDFNRAHAYRLMDSVKVINNVSESETKQPINLEQTRPLSKLEPAQQREAWQKAVDTAPDGKVTAAHVSKVVKELTGEQPKPYILKHNEPIIKQELISEDFQLAYDAMIIELKNARATKWKDTSYKGALEMMRTLLTITEQMGR